VRAATVTAQMKRVVLLLAGLAAIAFVASASARTEHYQVTVTVTGPGQVTAPAPDPTSGSIACPTQCSALMKQNTTVTFTATPNTGTTFSGWGGDCASAGTSSTCSVSMTGEGSNGSKSITAGFNGPPPPPPMFTLRVKKIGTGSGFVGGGGIDCGKTCSKTLVKGTKVKLLAIPDGTALFLGWSGACGGPSACVLTVKADAIATATFVNPNRPFIATLPAMGHAGSKVKLRYRVWDKTGMAGELLTVASGASILARITEPLRHVAYRRIYSVPWSVPAGLKAATLRLCGIAIDKASKRSPSFCAPLSIT
jgi:uncharacterized repeat protein (TIGR02543 family)